MLHTLSLNLLSLATASLAAEIPPSDSINWSGSSAFPNATSLEDLSNSRLSIEAEYGQTALPVNSVFMNVINAMTELAQENYYDPITPTSYWLPEYSDVMITPEAPAEGGTMLTRYIVLGLWKAIYLMAKNNYFRTAVFTIRWDETVVGCIKIAQSGAQLSVLGSNHTDYVRQRSNMQPAFNQTLSISKPSSFINITNSRDDIVTVALLETGLPLTASEVFIAVVYTIHVAAQFPSSQVAGTLETTSPTPFKLVIGLLGAQSAAPAFEYRWMVKGLEQIAWEMLKSGRFFQIQFRIQLDGIHIGSGFIGKTS